MDNSEFTKKELKEKFTNIKKAFESFDKIELKGRKHIQVAILGCYDIYLHYNEKLIRKRCKKAGSCRCYSFNIFWLYVVFQISGL